MSNRVLILGSGPNVIKAAAFPKNTFTRIVAINNAWRVRPDWDDAIFPEDFPDIRRPHDLNPKQRIIQASDYIPAQNAYGGIVFAGATMAFTAGYWALAALRPDLIAFLGCDMVYPTSGPTHYYGTGTPDPLRADITLRDLKAKSARLGVLAALQGCACVNLSKDDSELLFPRSDLETLPRISAHKVGKTEVAMLRGEETLLGYDVPTGRYWENPARFDPDALDALDLKWRAIWNGFSEQTHSEVAA